MIKDMGAVVEANNLSKKLFESILDNNPHTINYLIEAGVDVNQSDEWNNPPLHIASYKGRMEIVRILVDNGANLYAKDLSGLDAIQRAKSGGYEDVAKFLIESRAKDV